MDPSLENDPDLVALQRAAAVRRNRNIAIAAAVVLAPVLYWAMGFSAVRGMLEEQGYTDVKVAAASPFEFKFDAKKGASECSGAVTRLPFSTSSSSFCYSVDANGKASGSTGTTR